MKNHFIGKILASSLAITSVSYFFVSKPTQAQATKNIYSCINNNGVPTTIVDTQRGRIELIVWKSDYFRGSGWTPQAQCEEVTARFQKFSDNGTLGDVTTSVINKQKVICVSQGKKAGQGYECTEDSLLITLQPEDNPDQVLQNLFSNAVQVGGTSIKGDPEGKYVISINNYLKEAPIMKQSIEFALPLPSAAPNESLGGGSRGDDVQFEVPGDGSNPKSSLGGGSRVRNED